MFGDRSMTSRVFIGITIGFVVGLGLIAAFGFYWGYQNGNGLGGPAAIPPGVPAAFSGAFTTLAYFWWLAAVAGLMGGVAAFGSWFVRPKQKATSSGQG